MSNVTDKLELIFSDLIVDARVPVRKRTRLNCASWDSMAQLNLILALEQEFHITVSDEDAMDLNSYDAALQLIEEKCPAKED